MSKILEMLKKSASFVGGLITTGVINPTVKVGDSLKKYIPTVARHIASKLAGVLVAYGVISSGAAETAISGCAEIIGGALLWAGTIVWSFVEKKLIGKKDEAAK